MAKAKERLFESVKLPPGFRQVSSGNFPPIWNFKAQPVLQGTVHEIKTVATKIGRKAQDTRLMVIADADGVLTSVWESAALSGLFDEAQKGDKVHIQFTGMIKIKGRQQPMKGFTAGIAGDAPAASKPGKEKAKKVK